MKKLSLILSLIILGACAGTKTVRQSKKVIRGEWTLNAVTYSEDGLFTIKLLQDASKDCFEGSDWKFVGNNNRGNYNINKSGCVNGNRNFIFTVQDTESEGIQDFLIKPTDEKYRSETNKGFRLTLTQLTDTYMQWQQTVNVEGRPFKINMNFTKKQQ